MGGDADVVQVGLGQQGLEEGVGVAQAVLLDDSGVCGEAVAPIEAWDAQLASALDEHQGACSIRHRVDGIHGRQVQRPKLQAKVLFRPAWGNVLLRKTHEG